MIGRRVALAGALTLSACAAPAFVQTTLYLGRAIPGGGTVDDAALARFVAEEVVPRFPDGFTLLDATGHWRDTATGEGVREPTVLVVVLHPPGRRAAAEAIAVAYAERFGQQAVLRVETGAAVSFDRARPAPRQQ
ncbi:DUF3574 domain-containing protein [Elioraea sp.]|uniref:DUF3574 domain-containing protein n=1 Tax=Elioraea sp. TaxID=2185103 RepID=UPI0025C52ABC|nr:DUF3574 domain-containing protein [Elioraea sp.]